MPSRRIHKERFNTTPATDSTTIPAGSGTTTVPVNAYDLSHAQALMLELHLATISGDAIDSLDVKLQSASTSVNGITVFTTRARFPLIAGNATPVKRYILNLEQAVAIAQSEQSYESTADAGVSEIGSGTVINGPFPGKSRTAGFVRSGLTNQQASWQVLYVVTDANSNLAVSGTLTIWAVDMVRY